MQQSNTQLINAQQIACKGNNKAKMVCFNDSCLYSPFICNLQQCNCQLKTHKSCSFVKLSHLVEIVRQRKQEIPSSIRKSFQTIKEIYKEIIEQFSKDLNQLEQKIDGYGLKEYEWKFYNCILDKNTMNLNGKFISKLKQQIQSPKKLYFFRTQQQMKSYWQQKNKQLFRFRQQIKLLTLNQVSQTKSNIIKYQKLIQQFFEEKVKRFKLLFRASQNNFDTLKFHACCDNKTNTLTIVQTEFGKIIGGFTPLCWNADLDNTYVSDPSQKSFLFSLTNKEKYPLVTPFGMNAIFCHSKYGPTFGGGNDLIIYNNAHNISISSVGFPHSYNNGNYSRNQDSYKAFCGAGLGNQFKIKQWEIYQVQFS